MVDTLTIKGSWMQAMRERAEYGSAKRLVLGTTADFSEEDLLNPDVPIMVSGRTVYDVKVPSTVHDHISDQVTLELYHQAKTQSPDLPIKGWGTSNFVLWNPLFCHKSYGKQADANLGFIRAGEAMPAFVVEVGLHHEDLGLLLEEGASWFTVPSVQYILLVKVELLEDVGRMVRVLLLRRRNGSDPFFLLKPGSEEEDCRKANIKGGIKLVTAKEIEALMPVDVLFDRFADSSMSELESNAFVMEMDASLIAGCPPKTHPSVFFNIQSIIKTVVFELNQDQFKIRRP